MEDAPATSLGTACLGVSAHVATYGLWRRQCLNWGATTSEAEAVLPGDELDMHSADAIIPELQHMSVGDAWRLGSRGPVLRAERLAPERYLGPRQPDLHLAFSALFAEKARC